MMPLLRKYFAKSISPINSPEVFPWYGWLKRSIAEKEQIGEILIYLDDTDFINLNIDETSISYVFLFNQTGEEKRINYINFTRSKVSPVFYRFTSTGIDNYGFEPISVEVLNYSEILFVDKQLIKKISSDFLFNTKTFSIPHKVNKPELVEKDLADINIRINEVNFKNHEPDIVDCLAELQPEVQKYDMLSQMDLMSAENSFQLIDQSLKIDLSDIKISNLKNIELFYDAPMMAYNNINLKNDATFNFSRILFNPTITISDHEYNFQIDNSLKTSSNIINESNKTAEGKNFYGFLEPKYELTEIEIETALEGLNDFYKSCSGFLFNNRRAALLNNYCSFNEIIIINAIKLLAKIRAANKVLLIVSEENLNKAKYYKEELIRGSWRYYFRLYAPDLKIHMLNEDHGDGSEIENNVNGIYYTSSEMLKGFLSGRKITTEHLELFDAIIWSDFEADKFQNKILSTSLGRLDIKTIWILSNLPEEDIGSCLKKTKSCNEFEILNKHDYDSSKLLSPRVEENYFFDLNSQLMKQYESVLQEGLDKIGLVLQSGNLLRFQPNVYQLYHSLIQQTNFIEGTLDSPKASLLIYHLRKILSFTDRLLIFSQFDSHGLTPIQRILDELNISYLRFDSSDSAKSIREKIVQGAEREGKIVYLTSLKPKALQFNFPDVSHIIHYDSWWNPYTRWEIENKLSPMNGEQIFIYNYYYKNTLEGLVAQKIIEYGNSESNPLENSSPEQYYSIINEDFWKEALELKNAEEGNEEAA
jgi:hypothetical protein